MMTSPTRVRARGTLDRGTRNTPTLRVPRSRVLRARTRVGLIIINPRWMRPHPRARTDAAADSAGAGRNAADEGDADAHARRALSLRLWTFLRVRICFNHRSEVVTCARAGGRALRRRRRRHFPPKIRGVKGVDCGSKRTQFGAPSARKRAASAWAVAGGVAQRRSRSHSLARSLGRMSARSGALTDEREAGERSLPRWARAHDRSTADPIRRGAAEPTDRPSARPAAQLHPTVSAGRPGGRARASASACLSVSQRRGVWCVGSVGRRSPARARDGCSRCSSSIGSIPRGRMRAVCLPVPARLSPVLNTTHPPPPPVRRAR